MGGNRKVKVVHRMPLPPPKGVLQHIVVFLETRFQLFSRMEHRSFERRPLTDRPMFRWLRRDPKHLKERRQRMLDAVADYPIYGPPHWQGPNFVHRRPDQSETEHEILLLRFEERGHENFSYFLEHREERLAALSAFLAKFDVKMGLDDAGLAATSAWCSSQ